MDSKQWRAWYSALSWRHKIHHKVNMRLARFEDWLCEQPKWLSERDWLYPTEGTHLVCRALCGALGHYPDGTHCIYCGRPA